MYHVPYIPAITEGVEVKNCKQEEEAQDTGKADDTVKNPRTVF